MSEPTIRLLMPSAGRKVTLMRALSKHFKVYPGGLAPQASASCCLAGKGRFVELPPADAPDYGEKLLAAVERIGIQVVLPVRNEDMVVLDSLRQDLGRAGAVLAMSPLETIKVCLDKLALSRFLNARGIDTPRTCESLDGDGWLDLPRPYFVKPRNGSGSRRAQKVRFRDELEGLLDAYPDLVVQPFIDGQEYTVDMFFDCGKLQQYVVRQRVSVANGQMDMGIVFPDLDSDSFRVAIDIGKHMEFHGPINMQFIQRGGVCWVTDINPRFSGGIGLTIAAGCDFAAYLLEAMVGGEIHTTPPVIGTKAISYTDYVYA